MELLFQTNLLLIGVPYAQLEVELSSKRKALINHKKDYSYFESSVKLDERLNSLVEKGLHTLFKHTLAVYESSDPSAYLHTEVLPYLSEITRLQRIDGPILKKSFKSKHLEII